MPVNSLTQLVDVIVSTLCSSVMEIYREIEYRDCNPLHRSVVYTCVVYMCVCCICLYVYACVCVYVRVSVMCMCVNVCMCVVYICLCQCVSMYTPFS